MSELFLSWSCLPKDGTKKPDYWEDVSNSLNNVRLSSGCMTLDKLDGEGY
ncbi:hypothetical protein [Buttiauxella izardii]|nr:hypothetical protein [Buttiauxella izardii]